MVAKLGKLTGLKGLRSSSSKIIDGSKTEWCCWLLHRKSSSSKIIDGSKTNDLLTNDTIESSSSKIIDGSKTDTEDYQPKN